MIRIIDHIAWDTSPREITLNDEASINALTLHDPVTKTASTYLSKLL